MSRPKKHVCSSLDNRLKNTGTAPLSTKTATTVQVKESITKPLTVQGKESPNKSVAVQGKETPTKPTSARPTSRSRPATSSVTPRRSNSVNLGTEQNKNLNRTNSSHSHRSKNSQSCVREDAGKKNTNIQIPTTKRGEKPSKEIPQRLRTCSETKPSNKASITLPVTAASSPGTSSKFQTDLHEKRNKVIETQFIAKKRKFITLKRELLRKQKCVLELYSSMAEMRAQLIKSSSKLAEEDNWKLENIRIFDLGQLQDLKLAGCIETLGECKPEEKQQQQQQQQQQQNIQIVNTTKKGQCCTEGSGEEVPLVPQGSTLDIISNLENKLRKIPLDSLTLCHKMVSSRNSLLALVDALADDDGSGFTVEAELRRHLDEYQTEAEKFDKLLKDEQELQLQAVGDLISAIRGLSEENEKLRMLLSGHGVPVMQLEEGKEADKSTRERELETACADLDGRLKASTAEISELHSRVENIVDQLMAEREKNAALSRQMSSLSDHQIAANHLIQEMEEKLNEREAKVQKLQKVVDEQAKYRDMTLAAKASAELVSQLEKQRDSLQQQLKQLMEEKERTEKEATVLIFDLDAKLQTSNKRGEREIIKNEKLQEELNVLKNLLAETEARGQRLHQTVSASVQTDLINENINKMEDEDTLLNREIEQEHKINELWFELQSTEALLQAAQEKTELLQAEKAIIEKSEIEKKNQLQEKLKALEIEIAVLEKAEAERSKKMTELELEMERKQLMIVAEKDEEIVRLTKELKEAQKVTELNQQQFAKYEEKVSELYSRLTSVKTSEGNSKLLQQKVSELQNQVEEIQTNLTDVEKRNYQLEQMIVQKQLEMEVHDKASRRQQKTLKSKEEQVTALQTTLQENSESMEKMKCELTSKSEEMQNLYTTLEFKDEQLQRLEKMVRQLEEQRLTKACLRMSEYKNQARNKCPSILLPLSEFYKIQERNIKRGSKGMDLGSKYSLSGASSSSSSHISKKRGMPLDDGDQKRQSTDYMQGDRNNESKSSDTIDDFSEDLYRNFHEAIPRKSKLPLSVKRSIILSDNWWKQQQKKKKAALDLYQKNQHRIESYKAQKQVEKIMKYNIAKSPYSDTRDRGSDISKENMQRNDGLPDFILRKPNMYRPNFKTNFRSCRTGRFYRYLKFSNRYKLPKRACQIYPTIYEESENSEDDRSDSEVIENKGQSNAEKGDCKKKLNVYLDIDTDPELERTKDSGDNDNFDISQDCECDEVEEELKNDDDDDDVDDELEEDISIASSIYQTQQKHLPRSADTNSETFVKVQNYAIYNVIQESDEVHGSYQRCIERISPVAARLTDQDKKVRDLTPFLTEPTCKTQNNLLKNSVNKTGTNSDLEERKQSSKEVCRHRESGVSTDGEEGERAASTDTEQGTLFTNVSNERDFLKSENKVPMPIFDTKDWQSSFAPKTTEFMYKRKSYDRNLSAEEDDVIDLYSNYERSELPSELLTKEVFPDKEELRLVDNHKRSNHFQPVLKKKPLSPERIGDWQDSFRSPNNYLICGGDDRYELSTSDTINKVSYTDRSNFPSCEKELKVLFKRTTPITTNCILSHLEMEHLLNGSRSSLLKLGDSCKAIQPYNQMNDRQQEANIAQIYVREQFPKKNMRNARFPPKIVLGEGTHELFKHYRELKDSGEHTTGRGNYACIPKICMDEQIPEIIPKLVLNKIKLPKKVTSKFFRIGDLNVCSASSLSRSKLEQVVNRRNNIFNLYPVQHAALGQGEWYKSGIEQRQGDNNENIFEHFKYIRKYPPKLLLNEIIYPFGEGQRKVKKRKVTSSGYIQPVNTDELVKSSVAYLPERHVSSQVVSPQPVQRKRSSGAGSVSNTKQRQECLSDTSSGYIHPVDTDDILKSTVDYPLRSYLKRPQQLLQRKRSSKHLNSDVRSISENKQRKQCLSDTSAGLIRPVDADNLVKSVLAYLPNKCSGRQRPFQRKRLTNHLSPGVRSDRNNKQRKQYLADFYGIKKAESLSNFIPERREGPINKLRRQSNVVLKLPVDSPVTDRKSSVFQMTETCNSEVKKIPLIISSVNLHLSDAKTETESSDVATSESPSLSMKSNDALSSEKLNYIENDLAALNNMLQSKMDEILTKKRSQILSLIPRLQGKKERKSAKMRELEELIQLFINNASQSLITLMLRGYESAPSNITHNTLQMTNILPDFVIETTFCSDDTDDESLGTHSSCYDSLGDCSLYSSTDRTDDAVSWNSIEQSKEEDASNRVSSSSNEGSDENNGKMRILQCPFLLKSNDIPACRIVGDSAMHYDSPSTSLRIPESEPQLSKTSFHPYRQNVSEKLKHKDEIRKQSPVNVAVRNKGTENNHPLPVNETIPEIRPSHLITNLEDICEIGYPVTTENNHHFPVNETIPKIRPNHLITNLEDICEIGYPVTTYDNIINANNVIEPEPACCSRSNVSPSRYALLNMYGKSLPHNHYFPPRTKRSRSFDINYSYDYNSFLSDNYDLINDPYHPTFVRNRVYYGDHEYSYPYYPQVRQQVVITDYTDSESDDDDDNDDDDDDDDNDGDDDDSEYSDSDTDTSSDSCESGSVRYWPHVPHYNNYYYYEVERV